MINHQCFKNVVFFQGDNLNNIYIEEFEKDESDENDKEEGEI